MANIQTIDIRGARVHNLKDINVSVPLHQIVGIAGVSGSGKSSLALGVLYAEGSRRYLDSLSTYTRRRMTMASKATVDEVLHVPAALALRQRPGIAGIRSTFGTSTELLNSLRLMFSRLASHVCPNGHHVPPSLLVAAEKELVCPTCGVRFYGPSAEDLSFNGAGACPVAAAPASFVPWIAVPWFRTRTSPLKKAQSSFGVRSCGRSWSMSAAKWACARTCLSRT